MAEKTKCEICDRNFKNQEGLDAHNKAKHPESHPSSSKSSKPLLTKKTRNWGIFIIIIALLVFWIYSATATPGEYDDFAKCLTENGAKMYGAFWCPHCINQKKEFGKSWKVFENNGGYIECSNPDRSQNQICNSAGIQSYPTWEFSNGERISGEIPLAQLSQTTGCSLN